MTDLNFFFRRESERRNHSLARHADILAAVETRLSLLNMTFMKYVDSNLCCFIPGKVMFKKGYIKVKEMLNTVYMLALNYFEDISKDLLYKCCGFCYLLSILV